MTGVITTRRVTPLLRRTQLLPDESLPSLLERLTQLNYYPHSGVLGWICHECAEHQARRDNMARPKQAQTFLQLAQLTSISPEELFAASDHRFVPTLTPPGKRFRLMTWPDASTKPLVSPAIVRYHLYSASVAQFCPLCLQAWAYHRLSWVPVAASICLQHQCLLVHRCPQCDKRVSVQEIVNRHCQVCQTDLSTAQVVSVAGDTLGILSQQALQHWLSVAPAPILPDGYTLLQQPPAVLYRLLDGLRRSLLACRADWPNLPAPLNDLAKRISALPKPWQRLTPIQAYYLYRAAFTGILNWPQGLFQFLDAYSQRDPAIQASSSVADRLGTLWRDWIRQAWWCPEFEFVQQSFVDYLSTRAIPYPYALVEHFKERVWFIERTGLWTAEHTAQALGISVQELRRFLPCGPLSKCLWSRSRRNPPLFERDKVLPVKQQWQVGWSMRYACSWLGLEESDVVKLVELGVLTVECGLEGDDCADWVLNRQSVEAFFESVACRLKLYQEDSRTLTDLYRIGHNAALFGIDCVTLLQGVADGILPGYKREPELQTLASVCFLGRMITSLPDRLYAERGWVTGHEFARERGFAPKLVLEWMKTGLIEPAATFGRHRYFERWRLEQLAARHVLPA